MAGAARRLYLPGGAFPKSASCCETRRSRAPTTSSPIRARRGRRPRRKLAAVHDGFYRGEVAAEIAKFSAARDGLLAAEDLAALRNQDRGAGVGCASATPSSSSAASGRRGRPSCRRIALMSRFDLEGDGLRRAPDYCHLLIEAMKLAFADREQYYGDPTQAMVPAEVLLSDDYTAQRAQLIDHGLVEPRAASRRRTPQRGAAARGRALHAEGLGRRAPCTSTRSTRKGNMASFTPSGAWIMSAEVIEPLGFPLSVRMMTFYLAPAHHPNVVAPGKRPRTTLTPSMAFRNGKPWMTFGTMGGDNQGQWLLQFYLYRAAFGMSIQEAIEAPRLSTEHLPGFFAPHEGEPNRVRIEPRFGARVLEELRRRGHDLDVAPDWTEGFVSAAQFDPDTGLDRGRLRPAREQERSVSGVRVRAGR